MTSILVVDDEPAILDMLTYSLERKHFRVLTAVEGAEALRIAVRGKPSLVILDLMLPEVDGLEVCRQL